VVLDEADSLRHLATIRALDCFGEAALVARSTHPAGYRALRPTVLLTLGAGELEEALRETPDALSRIRTMVRATTRLARVPVLADLTTNQLMALALKLKDHTVEADRPVQLGGETARLYLVQEGAVELTAGEKKMRVDTGEWFGEMGLLGAELPRAHAYAIAPGVLLSLGAEDFRSAVEGAVGEGVSVKALANWRMFRTRIRA
jgi:CRP-like cAMP-binding protein